MQQLLEMLRANNARIEQLESKVNTLNRQLAEKNGENSAPQKSEPPTQPPSANPAGAEPAPTSAAAPAAPPGAAAGESSSAAGAAAAAEPPAAPPQTTDTSDQPDAHEHSMQMPGGGPQLKVRGFADFNLDFGPAANSLIFPLPLPVHNGFQFGEFDLFFNSKLSDHISFVSEVVIGSDPTNVWSLDIERLQLTYRVNPYFQISGGRYHTAIGYYNTAYHHGTWFQTATTRPFMYNFEDSGGVLPVHSVGITTTGLVPKTGALNMHWVAEISNGRASNPDLAPVQNFSTDRDYKAFNLAAYIRPEWINGLQIGGSYYHDHLDPLELPQIHQSISSLYGAFNDGTYELYAEAVLMDDHAVGSGKTYHSPLTYIQFSRKFGLYRPYFRYQYMNIPNGDPISIYTGLYEGPSAGVRMDFTEYVALKIQYNRLYQRATEPQNGVDLQMAFTF